MIGLLSADGVRLRTSQLAVTFPGYASAMYEYSIEYMGENLPGHPGHAGFLRTATLAQRQLPHRIHAG